MTDPKSRNTRSQKNHVSAVCLADVRHEDTAWLWPGYIPRGNISLLDGDPGNGKSFISCDLAARVTRGWTMPPAGGTSGGATPANVLILNAEDDPARTIRPRLEALGADLNCIHLLNEVSDGEGVTPVTFPGHLELLENTITKLQAALVVIDPLMAFLGGEVDSHRDSDIRRVLARVKRIAEKTQAAILVVRHLNKMISVGEAMYRGGGSIGIIGAARSALMVAKHPATPCLRVLARVKGNLCDEPPALAYAIEKTDAGVVVAWLGEQDMTANDLLAKKAPARPRAEALAEAEQFLHDELTNGPVAAEQMAQRAGENGISEITLRRAKGKLGIRSVKAGMSGVWMWTLPNAPVHGRDEGAHDEGAPEHNQMSAFAKTPENHEGAQVSSVTGNGSSSSAAWIAPDADPSILNTPFDNESNRP